MDTVGDVPRALIDGNDFPLCNGEVCQFLDIPRPTRVMVVIDGEVKKGVIEWDDDKGVVKWEEE